MSDRAPCMPRLQIHAKAATFQKPIGSLPSGVWPVQTDVRAISKKPCSPEEANSSGRTARAPTTNIRNIHGEHTVAKVASLWKPRTARVTTTAPTASTTRTKRKSVGYQSSCGGIPNGMRTAEAETVIMQPAMIEYRQALTTL